MKRPDRVFVVGAALTLATACAPPRSLSSDHPLVDGLAFAHVNVVDVERGVVLPDQMLLIAGNRIVDVRSARRARVPRGARTIDARGWYVIPGLWDMHAHLLGQFEQHAPVLLANGITGIRDPGNARLDTVRAVRERLGRATSALPTLITAGVLIDGNPPARPPGSVILERGEDASRLADSLLAAGVDYFKVYGRIRREAFLAIASEAKRRGVLLTGHVPSALTPLEVSDAGMRSIEHVFELPLACSTREGDMRRLRVEAEATTALRAVRAAIADTLVRSYDPGKCRDIGMHLSRNGTLVTPTLSLYRSALNLPATARDSATARYFPGGLQQGGGLRLPELSGGASQARMFYDELAAIVGELHRAGVMLLAGTDTPSPMLRPGFSLHNELWVLVEDGHLGAADALRTATLNPARYFSATDSMGTVERGKVASLVLLASNPLNDIRNTQDIVGVVARGTYLSRADLDALLAGAEQAARPHQ